MKAEISHELTSIVIVNYNGEKWLRKLFDSLLSQTHARYEIIFVDNASVDNSVKFIKNTYQDNRIKIVKNDRNLGFARGNNAGINVAAGEFIMLLNNDTWLGPDFLGKIINFYKENDFDVIAPRENDYEDKTKKEYISKIDPLGHPVYIYGEGMKDDGFYLPGICLFFKKESYLETMGLDGDFFMYAEEIDWFWRLNLLKKKFCHVNNLFIHHAGAGSTGGGIKHLSFLWRNQNTLQMLLKNYRWRTLFWVLPLYFIQNIFEIIFFVFILQPQTAYSYVQGWWFNIINFRETMRKRAWVQKNRIANDLEILRKMYIGFGKTKHLLSFYGHRI